MNSSSGKLVVNRNPLTRRVDQEETPESHCKCFDQVDNNPGRVESAAMGSQLCETISIHCIKSIQNLSTTVSINHNCCNIQIANLCIETTGFHSKLYIGLNDTDGQTSNIVGVSLSLWSSSGGEFKVPSHLVDVVDPIIIERLSMVPRSSFNWGKYAIRTKDLESVGIYAPGIRFLEGTYTVLPACHPLLLLTDKAQEQPSLLVDKEVKAISRTKAAQAVGSRNSISTNVLSVMIAVWMLIMNISPVECLVGDFGRFKFSNGSIFTIDYLDLFADNSQDASYIRTAVGFHATKFKNIAVAGPPIYAFDACLPSLTRTEFVKTSSLTNYPRMTRNEFYEEFLKNCLVPTKPVDNVWIANLSYMLQTVKVEDDSPDLAETYVSFKAEFSNQYLTNTSKRDTPEEVHVMNRNWEISHWFRSKYDYVLAGVLIGLSYTGTISSLISLIITLAWPIKYVLRGQLVVNPHKLYLSFILLDFIAMVYTLAGYVVQTASLFAENPETISIPFEVLRKWPHPSVEDDSGTYKGVQRLLCLKQWFFLRRGFSPSRNPKLDVDDTLGRSDVICKTIHKSQLDQTMFHFRHPSGSKLINMCDLELIKSLYMPSSSLRSKFNRTSLIRSSFKSLMMNDSSASTISLTLLLLSINCIFSRAQDLSATQCVEGTNIYYDGYRCGLIGHEETWNVEEAYTVASITDVRLTATGPASNCGGYELITSKRPRRDGPRRFVAFTRIKNAEDDWNDVMSCYLPSEIESMPNDETYMPDPEIYLSLGVDPSSPGLGDHYLIAPVGTVTYGHLYKLTLPSSYLFNTTCSRPDGMTSSLSYSVSSRYAERWVYEYLGKIYDVTDEIYTCKDDLRCPYLVRLPLGFETWSLKMKLSYSAGTRVLPSAWSAIGSPDCSNRNCIKKNTTKIFVSRAPRITAHFRLNIEVETLSSPVFSETRPVERERSTMGFSLMDRDAGKNSNGYSNSLPCWDSPKLIEGKTWEYQFCSLINSNIDREWCNRHRGPYPFGSCLGSRAYASHVVPYPTQSDFVSLSVLGKAKMSGSVLTCTGRMHSFNSSAVRSCETYDYMLKNGSITCINTCVFQVNKALCSMGKTIDYDQFPNIYTSIVSSMTSVSTGVNSPPFVAMPPKDQEILGAAGSVLEGAGNTFNKAVDSAFNPLTALANAVTTPINEASGFFSSPLFIIGLAGVAVAGGVLLIIYLRSSSNTPVVNAICASK